MRRAVVGIAIACASVQTDGQSTTGDVRGRLVSSTGLAVAEASIEVTGAELLGTRHARSALDGVFQILSLPPGFYVLRVTRPGFRSTLIDSVRVRLGQMVGLSDTRLEETTAQLTEVRISARRVALDPARTTVGATLEASDFAALPSERDYKSLIAITPHANTSYNGDPVNVAGATGLENVYYIDGVNVTAPRDASRGTSLPYNFIRSVEVRAGGYEAQYGKALGAIVNAVTYSGTNEFETNVFGFFTNDGFAAAPRATASLRETGSYSFDAGARFSGPLVRDRLWFSTAFNPQVERARRVIGALGTFTDSRRANVFAGKLTWSARPDLLAEFSVFGDPTTHDQVTPYTFVSEYAPLNPEPFLRRYETGGRVVSARALWNPTPVFELVADLAVSRSAENDYLQSPPGVKTLLIDNVNRTLEGGVGLTSHGSQGHRSLAVRGTLSAGAHTIVSGLEYEETRVHRRVGTGDGLVFRNDSSSYMVDSQASDGVFRGRTPTLFLQDSWRATDRLTINAGLRWTAQSFVGTSGQTNQRLQNQFQPRFGASWQLDEFASKRIFGSYGRFFQQAPLNLASLFYVDFYETWTYHSSDPRRPGAVPDSSLYVGTYEADFSRSVEGAQAEHVDEFSIGFEKVVNATSRLTLRATHRALSSAFLFGLDPTRAPEKPIFVVGTPGRGDMSFLPEARRDYTALEAALDGVVSTIRYRTSYTWSRSFGNYTGLHASDIYTAQPGANIGLFMAHQAVNSTGLMPNDRTHVFKLVASTSFAESISAGTFFTWQSGTPLNEFGAYAGGTFPPAFVSKRGTAGRTPAIWDLNLRLAYQPNALSQGVRLVLDVLHAGNPQKVVRNDQQHYLTLDDNGQQDLVNPNYLRPMAYQPPMTLKLGLEWNR